MFQLEWVPSAANDLATIWLAADSDQRRAITCATNEIDSYLRSSPGSAGDSRPGDHRILLAAPLGVTYKIEFDDRRVRV